MIEVIKELKYTWQWSPYEADNLQEALFNQPIIGKDEKIVINPLIDLNDKG